MAVPVLPFIVGAAVGAGAAAFLTRKSTKRTLIKGAKAISDTFHSGADTIKATAECVKEKTETKKSSTGSVANKTTRTKTTTAKKDS